MIVPARRDAGQGLQRKDYELLALIAVPTEVKREFALLPRVVMAPMQTTMIRASITAYSTAVGPSSLLRNLATRSMDGCILLFLLTD
jgi:hypothetical protein